MITSEIVELPSTACALVFKMAHIEEGPLNHINKELSNEYGAGWKSDAKEAEVLPEGFAWHLRNSRKSTLTRQRIMTGIGGNNAEANKEALDPYEVNGTWL